MCKKLLFGFLSLFAGLPLLVSCGRETSSEWYLASGGIRLYVEDSLSTLFTKLTYEWDGDVLYGLAHGRGNLIAVDKKGEIHSSKETEAYYGLTSPTEINTLKTPGSSVYYGESRKGEPHGFGLKKHLSRLYIGDFHKGQGDGHVYILDGDKLRYDGEWKKGMLNGYGEMYAEDGSFTYSGDFKKDEFSGHGTKLYSDSTMYVGDFKNGEYCGKGVLYAGDGSEVYRGRWKEGLYNGKGTLSDTAAGMYAGTHIWKRGELPEKIKALYDRIPVDSENYARYYAGIQRYELYRGWFITGAVVILLLMAVLLIRVNARSWQAVKTRKDPMAGSSAYWLLALGGLWGLHRAYLAVEEKERGIKVLCMSQYLLFAVLLAVNLQNIAICGLSPVLWAGLSDVSVLTVVLLVLDVLWLIMDIFWVPYRIYVLTSLYYRRSPEEMDILQGNKTKVEEFYEELGPYLDKCNNRVQEILSEAHEVMSRNFESKGVVSKLAKKVARDGSLEFEQKKLEDLSGLVERAERQVSWVEDKNLELYSFLQDARLAAYRNMYLAKELIAQVRESRGKEQTLRTDIFKGMDDIDIEIDWSAMGDVSWNVDGALSDFTSVYKGLTKLGFGGNKGALVAGGLAALGAVLENIDARNEQKDKAVKAQGKIVDGLEKISKQMLELSGEILRNAEKMSALFMANKAFVQAYAHLRDTVFGEVSFRNWRKGVNKKNPVFESTQFEQDIHHLTLVCSEYNKINKAK